MAPPAGRTQDVRLRSRMRLYSGRMSTIGTCMRIPTRVYQSKSSPPSRLFDSGETDSNASPQAAAASSSGQQQDYDACPLLDENGYQAGIVRGSRLQYNDPSGLPLRRSVIGALMHGGCTLKTLESCTRIMGCLTLDSPEIGLCMQARSTQVGKGQSDKRTDREETQERRRGRTHARDR